MKFSIPARVTKMRVMAEGMVIENCKISINRIRPLETTSARQSCSINEEKRECVTLGGFTSIDSLEQWFAKYVFLDTDCLNYLKEHI